MAHDEQMKRDEQTDRTPQEPKGFWVRALRPGTYPTGWYRNRDEVFFLDDPKYFSDSTKRLRNRHDSGWMERCSAPAARTRRTREALAR